MVLVWVAVAVQTPAEAPREKGGMGYFLGGVGFVYESGNNAIIGSTGGGGHSLSNNWVLGGEGHSVFGPENAGGYGFLNIGYTVLNKKNILVYPLLGFGGGSLTREADSKVSVCVLLNPSVDIDYLFYTSTTGGILVGLRAGYTFPVYSDTWNWGLAYVRLVLGGFGFGD